MFYKLYATRSDIVELIPFVHNVVCIWISFKKNFIVIMMVMSLSFHWPRVMFKTIVSINHYYNNSFEALWFTIICYFKPSPMTFTFWNYPYSFLTTLKSLLSQFKMISLTMQLHKCVMWSPFSLSINFVPPFFVNIP